MLHISSEKALHQMYMPFISGGGLFVPEKDSGTNLGTTVFLLLRLLDESSTYGMHCKIVWVTPGNSTRKNCLKMPGVGLQFLGSDGRLRAAIETYLVSMLDSSGLTLSI